MEIAYEVIAVNGANATVRYSCGEQFVDVGMDLPITGTREEIDRAITQMTPVHHFERLLSPVPEDALASLIGATGVVIPAVSVVPVTDEPKAARIISFEDA